MSFLDYFSRNIGIDLGTANSLVYLAGQGIVVNHPTVVAMNNKTGQLLAVGEEARKMLGRTPNHITVVKPLVAGIISDFEVTQEMLRHFLREIGKRGTIFNFRRAVIGVPSNLTEVERKSVEDVVIGAGVNKAYIIEEPVAAALGARLPIGEPVANMIVDIGGGTTEVAVISMGGTVTSKSLKVAGDKLNEEIIRFVRDEFRLGIGEPTAEELKVTIGSAVPLEQKTELTIRGRDLGTGLPREVVVRDAQIRAAITRHLKTIVETIREVIETAPPELVGDMLQRGIYLCGGGSLLKGIDQLISKELAVNVAVVEDPLTCVVRGTGVAVENFEKYTAVLDNPFTPRTITL